MQRGGKLEAQKFENQNVTNESKPKAALADEGDVTLDADIDVATQTEIPAESVAQIGENAYPTLEAAFEAAAQATEATTITLLSNITIESDLNNAARGYFNVADGKNVTLDLGGKKITATDNSTGNFILFYNYGEFTIKNGTVELTATNNRLWNAESAIVLNRGGIFNCESGTYTHKGGSDMSFVFDNSGNYYGDATMNIGVQQRSTDAPVLTSSYIAIRNRMEQNSHGASGTTYLNVYGGTISGTSRAVWAQAASVSETAPATGEINVEGGNIGLIDTPRSTGAVSMTTISGGTVAAFKGEVGELQVVAPGEITGEITILTPGGESADYIIDENGNYIEPTIVEVGSQDALQSAINDSQSGELIKVTANIELTSSITIPTGKYVILDLNGKTVTANCKKAFEVHANATIKNGKIWSQQRCVDTRTNVVLTLADVTLEAPTYYSTHKNQQPLTIGGSVDGTEIVMTNVNINAGTTGYAIISFVKTNLTATNSNFSGYSALYVKPGSEQSEFNFVESTLVGDIGSNDVEGNSFATIATEEKNVTVTLDANSKLESVGQNHLAISVESEGNVITVAGDITATNFLDGSTNVNANTIKVKAEYADELLAEGYATIEADANGLVEVSGPAVAKIGETGYATLQEAIDAATEGQTVTVINDVELESTVTIAAGKVVTLDLNGKTINTAWENESAEKHYYAFINEGTLTITDNSSAEAKGVINARGNYNDGILTLEKGTINAIDHNGGYGVQNRVGSKFTMNGGLIATTNEDGDTPGNGYDATTVRVESGAEFIMNGGEINNISNFTIAIENYGTTTIKENAGEVKSVHTTLANHGTMTINGGTFICDGLEGVTAHALWATVGKTTINGGTFNGKDNYNGFNVDAEEGAVVEINGGNFESVHSGSLYGKGTITVKGGTFFDNVSVSERCAEDYAALPDLNGNYIVGVKPTATVNNLGMTTVAAGDYMVYGSGTNTEDMPLSFVMQFLADQDAEDMATSPFADWYGDFVITFTGLENGSFTADGCYLAGHYGDFGWVKVPVDGMTIEEGERYPVMLGVGMGQKYDYICSSVEDFKCALYLTDEILAANPNIKVNLELAIVDNSQGEDAAASALVENENVYKVVDYNYDAIDFNKDYVARIGNAGYTTLAAAVEAATEGQTIVLLQNIDLTGSLIVEADQTVILDLNGKKINYNSTTQGEAMITNRGNLTINDSGNAGEIYYNYIGAADPTYGKGNYTISNGGTLTVNGGKIHIADLRAHAKYPIDNNSTSGDAILVINGGHLYNYNTSAIRQFCNSTKNKNSVTINGGLIEGYCAIWMQNPGKKTVNGQLAITGGEIEIRTTASAYVNGTSDIDEVNSRIYCTIDGEGGAWDESSAVEITGGTINENVYLGEESPASMTLYKEAQFNGYVEFDLSEGRELVHNGLSNVTVTKNITRHPVPEDNNEYVGGWYTISSPVGTVGHNKVDGLLNGTHDLYRYNEETMIWENVKDATNEGFTTLESGRGYLYANTADTELSFTGNLVAESVAQAITVTDNNLKGFNLIGNPFTYNITMSNMSGASLAEGFYTLSNHGAWQPNAKTATIAPMQGALIKATETTANFTIAPNSAKRSESENKGQIKIEVSNDNYNDVAYVSFNEGIGLDKIEHRNANIPMVYVPVDGINYAIATMSQDVTEVPVSFRAMTMGQYTIGAEAQDCEYAMMTLVDRLTGTETNLLLEDYTFVATTKDNADRFIIKLAKINADGENEDNFAFINNGMMYIYNIEGQGMVSIYDVTGRPVAEFNVETSANIPTSELTTGIYIIRMTDNNGVKVQKILID